jgi:hypothetical protein
MLHGGQLMEHNHGDAGALHQCRFPGRSLAEANSTRLSVMRRSWTDLTKRPLSMSFAKETSKVGDYVEFAWCGVGDMCMVRGLGMCSNPASRPGLQLTLVKLRAKLLAGKIFSQPRGRQN